MLRRTNFWSKVTRSWTKSSIIASSSSTHFPYAIRVDPTKSHQNNRTVKQISAWKQGKNVFVTSQNESQFWQKTAQVANTYCELVHFWRPAGWKVLLYPCYWGCSLAVTHALCWDGADPAALFAPLIPPHQAFALFVGAYVLRACTCIIYDLMNGKYTINPVKTASCSSSADATISRSTVMTTFLFHFVFGALTMISLSPSAIIISLAALPIVISHLLLKRYAWPAQLTSAMYINWGIFVGYAAILNHVDLLVCVPLYLAAIMWTLVQRTIHAFQYTNDEVCMQKRKLDSVAAWFASRQDILRVMILPIFAGVSISAFTAGQNAICFVGIIMCMLRLLSVVNDVNFNDRWSCEIGFKRNIRVAFCVLIAMFVGNLLWAISSKHELQHDEQTNTATHNSAISLFLQMNQLTPLQVQDADSLKWLDRVIHPVFVQTQMAKIRGDATPPPIPAWMRREYLGDNVAWLLRFIGCSQSLIIEWVKLWFGSLDHYNLLPGTLRE